MTSSLSFSCISSQPCRELRYNVCWQISTLVNSQGDFPIPSVVSALQAFLFTLHTYFLFFFAIFYSRKCSRVAHSTRLWNIRHPQFFPIFLSRLGTPWSFCQPSFPLHTSISISLSSSCISVSDNSKLEIHQLISHIFVGSAVNVVDCILAYMRLVLLEDTTRWCTLSLCLVCCPCCCWRPHWLMPHMAVHGHVAFHIHVALISGDVGIQTALHTDTG